MTDRPGAGPPPADILIVDDNPTNLQALSCMLRDKGYRARPVLSGELALQAARNTPPDLILLDINMPEMSGFEVCERLKADPALSEIPVIFLSGLTETTDKVRAFAAGGVDYVTKPFQFDEMGARIGTHLKLRQLQKTLERHNRHLEDLVREKVKEILNSQMATILALSKLAEYRDRETGNHLLRVQRYCRALACHLASEPAFRNLISDTFIEDLFHASPLHDIGKVGIPDQILLKEGPLSKDERVIMQRHTVMGAEILSAVFEQYPSNDFVRMGLELSRYHHERWDGTGYPDGLSGEAVPLSARILIIADQYDALRNRRPYKPPLNAAVTFAILTQGDGRTLPSHFDPRVLSAFKEVRPAFEAICDEFADEPEAPKGGTDL